MEQKNLLAKSWPDYELVDSGGNKRLERFGKFLLIRPETQALWAPVRLEAWKKANAEFFMKEGKGAWRGKMPGDWEISWNDVRVKLRLTNFKHVGIFPEQAVNWVWIREHVQKLEKPKVLNLFGYTGIASIVAAKASANVTHVDASKQSNAWAKENVVLSGVRSDAIRYILDDALKFAEREARRGAEYEGIILDPPAFGRGAKGEVWRIEEDLPRLLTGLSKIFSKKPGAFFLLNGYASEYSPQSFLQAVESIFKEADAEFGELCIEERNSQRVIPSGIYVRFER